MNVKIKLTVTGQNPPNRTRQLVDPKVIEFTIPESQVDRTVRGIEAWIKTLESFKSWLKV